MPDMDEMIRRIRRDMDTELRKRARRALTTGGTADQQGATIPAQPPGTGRNPALRAPLQQPE
ncbi:hypothetical protein AB0F13_21845 [Streptomyces sp. NPDC026206]|uniref:hypothetical protein n=1 Tax=Streptomyces sp. NPDC026206 TaxID=3157089 RepID=UPI0033FDAC79